jgi:ribosomal protein S18 acetylase RimI-like enzyme
MNLKIRAYHTTDLSCLYRICLLTGHNGTDATSYLKDPDLVGHLYAAPYAIFEPNLCFILDLDYFPCGYILGTRDSVKFYEKCEEKWFSKLRKRYLLPEKNEKSLNASFIRNLHQNQVAIEGLEAYPAHLHIDVLPIAQGKGYGKKLIEVFLNRLQSQDIQGVHLIASKNNQSAIGFYKKVGFHEVKQLGGSVVFGQKL